jgi:outer membrane immunogenic protein
VNLVKSATLAAAFIVSAGVVSVANAADVYERGSGGSFKDAPSYAPAITWTGFYIGAHAGSTFDDKVDIDLDAGGSLSGDFDETGLAGLHIGYNWQTSSKLVLGIEGSIDVPFDDDAVDYLASIRGRIGYAAGDALLYITGGAAFADDGVNDTHTGWVAGGGVDYKIRSNISIGLEALYYDFDEDFDNIIINGENAGSGSVDESLWTIQARLTYHFSDDRAAPLK